VKSRTGPRMLPTRAQESVNGTNSSRSTIGAGKCRACLKPLPQHRRVARYCSGRCRLRAWAIRELARALQDGSMEGLRGELRDYIAEAVREER
jgi:hypothetical protein